MGDKPTISISLGISNIGPLTGCSLRESVRSLQIGIYANNGSGKTFVSRMLRLAEQGDDEIDVTVTDSYLTRNLNKGSLSLEIRNPKDAASETRSLVVELERGVGHTVENDTDYLFHVFNSDYVRENIEDLNYSPSGEIEGYILGKSNIDVTKEKKELERLQQEREAARQEIEELLREVRKELQQLGVRATTTEYRDLTFENVVGDEVVEESRTFTEVKAAYRLLNSIPDDQADVVLRKVNLEFGSAEQIRKVMSTAYARSSLSEAIAEKIKAKLGFIEAGLDIVHQDGSGEACPFCEQHLGRAALDLIATYERYFADEEAKVNKEISTFRGEVQALITAFKGYESSFMRTQKAYDELKNYFPSQKDSRLSAGVDVGEVIGGLEEIIRLLDKKREDITSTDFDTAPSIGAVAQCIDDVENAYEVNFGLVEDLNSVKNDSNTEKLELRRALCRSALGEARSKGSGATTRFRNFGEQAKRLGAELEEKENSMRASKRARVATAFRSFLDFFFGGKYTFDEESFSLEFNGWAMGDEAPRVLSDGEKNIVALCLFLAETHVRVKQSADYDKLLFVIDDPISSLDFHYVYALAELLRDLKDHFPMPRSRLLILTHNMEFMSIMMRNRILRDNFILSRSAFFALRDALVMPYEHHLRDIYEVAEGISEPTHHTANSIRHVLETINNFEEPSRQLKTFLRDSAELQSSPFLYTLINDGSHGAIRNQSPYTDEAIIEGCRAVLSMVRDHFPGQVKKIEDR